MSDTIIEAAAAPAEAAPEITIDAPKADAPAEAAAKPKFSFKPRMSRIAILALAVAASAALGSMVGSLAGSAVMRASAPEEPSATATLAKGSLSLLSADIASLKSTVEASAKAAKAQTQQLAERIDRVEKTTADAIRSAKLSEPADRKAQAQASAPETTGSISVAKDSAAKDTKDVQRPAVLPGWVLRDVFDGRAMIESRNGLYEVGPGSNIPGLGRIEKIVRQDGRWAVFTPRGIIVSSR